MPNPGEQVESLITFGAQSDKRWGDDNFSQTFFFLAPTSQRDPIYIRVWDPGTSGGNDGNPYRYFFSPSTNVTVERGNAFTY